MAAKTSDTVFCPGCRTHGKTQQALYLATEVPGEVVVLTLTPERAEQLEKRLQYMAEEGIDISNIRVRAITSSDNDRKESK